MGSFLVGPHEDRMSLLDFLAGALNNSRRGIKAILDRRDVFVNEKRVWMARHELHAGDRIEVLLSSEEQCGTGRGANVLFRDNWYAVMDKPSGIVTCGTGDSFELVLRREMNAPGLAAVHRLDRDTTGCLIFAFDPGSFEAMIPLFRNRLMEKEYLAMVEGCMRERRMTITAPVDGEKSVTHVEVMCANGFASCLRVRIETGRTHQIRQHLASTGHPVLGDREYAGGRKALPEYRRVPRQMLHAALVGFPHPFTGKQVSVSAPVPDDFRQCLALFGLRLI